MAQSYIKPALTADALIEQLRFQGLIVQDATVAIHCLKAVGYHRLSAYFEPFRESVNNQTKFKPKSTFEDIWKLYLFDQELRLLVVQALEIIEVAFRAAISDTMSLKYGTHWYLQPENFGNQERYYGTLKQIAEVCEKKDDPAVIKYYDIYHHPEFPPSWVIMENLSFGTCVNVFRNLNKKSDKKAICEIFQYHPMAVESWISALRYTRNLCAHHSRLWNRWFVVCPTMSYLFKDFKKERTFYAQVIIISKLLQHISPKLKWKNQLYELLNSNQAIPIDQMGFPTNCKAEHILSL